jgi:hypothetical protein
MFAFAVDEMRVKLFRGSTDVNKPRRTPQNFFSQNTTILKGNLINIAFTMVFLHVQAK